MLKKIIEFKLNNLAGIIAFVGFFAMWMIINFLMSQNSIERLTDGYGIFDLHFNYSNQTVYSMLQRLGTEGRHDYLNMLPFDYIFSILFSFAFAKLFQIVLGKGAYSSKIEYIILIPYLRGLMDWLENTFLFVIISAFPQKFTILITTSSFVTSIKWVLMILTLTLPVVIALNNIIRKISAGSKAV